MRVRTPVNASPAGLIIPIAVLLMLCHVLNVVASAQLNLTVRVHVAVFLMPHWIMVQIRSAYVPLGTKKYTVRVWKLQQQRLQQQLPRQQLR